MKPVLIGIVALGVVVCCGIANGLDLPFIVSEPAGAARGAETVSGGIPMPEGVYKDPSKFSLYNGDKEIPVQVSPTIKYPDGSLHWVLVSFPVSLDANASKTFTLKDKPSKAKPKNPVTVSEDGVLVKISNGIVSFSINKDNFNGLEDVSYQGKQIFKTAKTALLADNKGGPGALTHFEYRYNGPVRVSLYIKGTYAGAEAPTWSMVITLNANESVLHIDHNLRNGAKSAKKKTAIANSNFNIGLNGSLSAGTEGSIGKSITWKRFSGDADVLVFVRHGGRKLKGKCTLDIADNELAMNLGGANVELEWGEHHSSSIDISFDKAVSPEALAAVLHARAPSAWYSEHDGLGLGHGFGSYSDETDTYKAWGWKNADDPKKKQTVKPDPSFYKSSAKDVHFDTECDHLQGVIFGYIRTGQRGFLDQAHGWGDYWRTFFVYRSNEWFYGKDGVWNTPKWGSSRHSRGCTEGCHNYGTGLFNYALITGDIDALEAAFDCAEFTNVSWSGQYSKQKPGESYSAFGTRGFSRNFVTISRAYDIARTPEWKEPLDHFIAVMLQSPARDCRGFTRATQRKYAASVVKKMKKSYPEVIALMEKEGVEGLDYTVKNAKYGEWAPKSVMSWPETIMNRALNVSYAILIKSENPADQIVAEDMMDHAIAQAYCGVHYLFNPIHKAINIKTILDYPIPDYMTTKYTHLGDTYNTKTDSWYTKWWPNVYAIGYRLTGDPVLLEKCKEVTWWSLSRIYYNPPKMPQGDAPLYSSVHPNTKGDFMTTTCMAFGLHAFPKKDTTPPAAVTDLKVKSIGDGKVQITWTAPADEGGDALMRYQIKWSEKPLVNYLQPGDEYRSHFKNGALDVTYWTWAKNVAGEPDPQTKGKKETMTLSVPTGKTLHFGIRSYDTSHNRSPMSNATNVDVK